MHRLLTFLVVASVVLGLYGCSSGAGEPTASSARPTSTMAEHYESGPSRDTALYEEAKAVFLRMMELRSRYEVHGDYSQFPAELSEVVTEPVLEALQKIFNDGKTLGLHAPEGAEPVVTVEPYWGVSSADSAIAIQACIDGRGFEELDANNQAVAKGNLVHQILFFRRIDGHLKIFSNSFEVVKTCPFN